MAGIGVGFRDDLGLWFIGDFTHKIPPNADVGFDLALHYGPIDLSNHTRFKLFCNASRGPTVPSEKDGARHRTIKPMGNTKINAGPRLLARCQKVAEHFRQRGNPRWGLDENPPGFVDYEALFALVKDLRRSPGKIDPALGLRHRALLSRNHV